MFACSHSRPPPSSILPLFKHQFCTPPLNLSPTSIHQHRERKRDREAMVSFQTLFPTLNQKKMILDHDHDDEPQMIISNSKKRKWGDFEAQVDHEPWKNSKATTTKSLIFHDIELHLETPLPSEWQRCLDIQSGEIHFYNTRTRKRTAKDPRREPSPALPEGSSPQDSHMSLDLELNLPCHRSYNSNNSSSPPSNRTTNPMTTNTKNPPSDLLMSLSSITKQASYNFEEAEEEVEMVAAACMKCHMLVMLCKSSPMCPNCKFVHPPYQTLPDVFKPRLSLSC